MFRWFSNPPAAPPNEEQQSCLTQDDIKGLQRTLRKLSTSVEEHVEALRGFDEQVQEVKGLSSIQEPAWITVLDRLYQLYEALDSEDHRLASELFHELREIEVLARLTPIAQYEDTIDPTECQAVATVDVEESRHGVVMSIVRQGYRRPNGSLVREAVVVLGRFNAGFREESGRSLKVKEIGNG